MASHAQHKTDIFTVSIKIRIVTTQHADLNSFALCIRRKVKTMNDKIPCLPSFKTI